ncbi:AEC family transporter [Thermoproteota archaeon]
MIQSAIFTFNITAPVFIMIFIGFFLRKINLINESFSKMGSSLVFNLALPALLIIKLIPVDIHSVVNFRQIAFCYAGTISAFLILWISSKYFIDNCHDRGAFIQGSFRSNYALVGIPLIINLFGDAGLVNSAIVLSAIIPINNILSVTALTIPCKHEKNINIKDLIFHICTNPLIIGTLIGVSGSLLNLSLPQILLNTGQYFTNLAIPLALISIGASLHFESLKKALPLASLAAFIKLIFIPIIVTVIAIQMGFRNENLASIFFLFTAPTALSSYIMAEAMKCSPQLSSTIVILTTSSSVLTISIGVFIMKWLNLF